MNKIITDLHNQAISFSAKNGGLRISSHIPNDYIEKLVELVVLECIAAHEDDYGGDIIGRVLKEHFGMEK